MTIRRHGFGAVIAGAAALAGVSALFAQVGGVFDLRWTTIDAGGATSSADGVFVLSGAIGQADAAETMSGGAFTLTGGFWSDVTADCPADLSGDGEINGVDLANHLSQWGQSGVAADLNGDDTVDGADLANLLSQWGTCA